MKRHLTVLAIFIVAILAATLACGETTPQVRVPEATSPPGEEPPEPSPTMAPLGSSRSNPAPPGAEVDISDMTIVVGDIVRPADDVVAEGNMFNPEPESGNEFLIVGISLTCNKGPDETCSINPYMDLKLVGSAGISRDPEIMISGVDGILESSEFYGGSTVTGGIVFQVGQGEEDLILIYEELFGFGKAFLAVE